MTRRRHRGRFGSIDGGQKMDFQRPVWSGRRIATATTLTATFAVAAAAWIVVIRQMNGMDMGVATRLGSFTVFIALWISMMAAMMLPGAAPAVARRAQAGGPVHAVPLFVVSYLGVWVIVGAAVFVLYRPHTTFTAGAIVVAAGVYELTGLKQHFRRRAGSAPSRLRAT
jgi:hypothetical protein